MDIATFEGRSADGFVLEGTHTIGVSLHDYIGHMAAVGNVM